MTPYHNILNVSPDATPEEIKKAFRRLSKKYHPDVSKNPNAKEKFIRIHEAYKFLSSTDTKREFKSRVFRKQQEEARKAYEERKKREARAYARKMAEQAERMDRMHTQRINFVLLTLLGVGVLLNLWFLVDYCAPLLVSNKIVTNVSRQVDYQVSFHGKSTAIYGDPYRNRIQVGEKLQVSQTRFHGIIRKLERIDGREGEWEPFKVFYHCYAFFSAGFCFLWVRVIVFFRKTDRNLSILLSLCLLSLFQFVFYFIF